MCETKKSGGRAKRGNNVLVVETLVAYFCEVLSDDRFLSVRNVGLGALVVLFR